MLHLEPDVVALARALAYAGKDRIPFELSRDPGDHLLNNDRLAQAGAAEQPGLAAPDERREQVDDLDARDQLLGFGRQIDEFRWRMVNRAPLLGLAGAPHVDRLTDKIEHPPERLQADRNCDGPTGVLDRHPPNEPVGRAQGHRPHAPAAKVLGHLAP